MPESKRVRVAIEVNEKGFGKIAINGVDISNSVMSLAMNSTPGTPTMIQITLNASVSASGMVPDEEGALNAFSEVAGRG